MGGCGLLVKRLGVEDIGCCKDFLKLARRSSLLVDVCEEIEKEMTYIASLS